MATTLGGEIASRTEALSSPSEAPAARRARACSGASALACWSKPSPPAAVVRNDASSSESSAPSSSSASPPI
eukprot:190428-Alexandrium_andersonii.AAC.1